MCMPYGPRLRVATHVIIIEEHGPLPMAPLLSMVQRVSIGGSQHPVRSHALSCGDIGYIACRTAPLTSVAQWMSGLFGHADLTPSDLVAALSHGCHEVTLGALLAGRRR